MESSYVKRRKLKLWIRLLLLFMIVLIFSEGIIMIIRGLNRNRNNEIIYNYNIKQNINYNLNIYKSSLFETEVLGMDETYVSNVIKNINANFKYQYKNDKKIPLNYEYLITATIYGEYTLPDEDEKSELWTKEYTLLETTRKETSKNKFEINEDVKIDYNFYNQVVSNFRNEVKLPISAYLLVEFDVKVSGVIDHKSVRDTQTMKLKIPLNQQAFKITKDYKSDISKGIKKYTKEQLDIELKKEICGGILIVVAIFLFVLLYKNIFDIAKKNGYNANLAKLLKEYGDIIVEINSEINKKDLQVIEVKNFNEMLDLEEELKIPIMFYEIIEDRLGEFTITHNNILYRFVIEEEEM